MPNITVNFFQSLRVWAGSTYLGSVIDLFIFSQYIAGHLAGVKSSQSSDIVGEVAKALVSRSRDFIKWPKASEMRILADENNEEFGIPDLPLGVDGCHVRLWKKPWKSDCPPRTTPDNYVNYKKFASINMQVVGDSRHCIRNCFVVWLGSTHDGRVWRTSKAKKRIERQSVFAIAADSAYPIARTVVKPYLTEPTDSHKDFNKAQRRIRNECTEKIFGQVNREYRLVRFGAKCNIIDSQ